MRHSSVGELMDSFGVVMCCSMLFREGVTVIEVIKTDISRLIVRGFRYGLIAARRASTIFLMQASISSIRASSRMGTTRLGSRAAISSYFS